MTALPTNLLIHTNAPVDAILALRDADKNWITFDDEATLRCSIRRERGSPVLLTFETGDIYTPISLIQEVTPLRTLIWLYSTIDVSSYLEPGLCVADILQTDDPGWLIEFQVSVIEGITPR